MYLMKINQVGDIEQCIGGFLKEVEWSGIYICDFIEFRVLEDISKQAFSFL